MTTFVLVHGAWHTSWVWAETQEALAALGHDSHTVDLPSCGVDPTRLGTLADDAAAIEGAVAAASGPTVVVAHSYGGVAATQADLAGAAGLVLVAAFVPEPGMSLVAHFADVPPYADVRPDEGVVVFDAAMAGEVLYNDLDEAESVAATDRLVLHSAQAVTTPVDRASWQEIPTAYVVCTEDHTVPVEIQRMFAARAQAVLELATSHSPMLSRPQDLAAALVGASLAWTADRAP
jgi:pimeloyl-ACP methyl ester carboxylesterase